MFFTNCTLLHNNIQNKFQSGSAMTFTAISWSFTYMLLKTVIPESAEFTCRIITFIHGFITSILGLYACSSNHINADKSPSVNDCLESFVLVNSWGYFVFDLLWCLWYQTETKLMVVHHVYSVFALGRLLKKTKWHPLGVCGLGFLELTNPFLQTRWFLRNCGYMKTKYYSIAEGTFMILFVLIRGVGGTVYVIHAAADPNLDLEIKCLVLIIYTLSVFFMLNIARYLKLRYMNSSTPQHSPLTNRSSQGQTQESVTLLEGSN